MQQEPKGIEGFDAPGTGVEVMTEKKDRDRVMAEITLSHLLRLANEQGLYRQPGISCRILQSRRACVRDVEAHDAGWRGFYCTQLTGAVY
jgi:hypothetical protein